MAIWAQNPGEEEYGRRDVSSTNTAKMLQNERRPSDRFNHRAAQQSARRGVGGKTRGPVGPWVISSPHGHQNENWKLSSGRRQRVEGWDGMGEEERERGTGKGDSRGPEGLPPGVGVVGSGFSPQPRCFCAAHPRTHPLFSLRRFASRRHHPSPPLLIHTRPPLPTLNFVAFPSSNPRISSHHACHRNAIASSFLSPIVSQAPRRSDMRRAQRACDRCRIAPYPTPARRISRPGARKHSPESGACSPAVADL